jgi:hypothetical protein
MAALVARGGTMFPPASPPSSAERFDLRVLGLRANESPFGPQTRPLNQPAEALAEEATWQR